jgi:hypothetical protein
MRKTEIKLAFQNIRCFLLEFKSRKMLEKDAIYEKLEARKRLKNRCVMLELEAKSHLKKIDPLC